MAMVSLPGVTVSGFLDASTDALAEGVPADGDALVVEVGDEQAASANEAERGGGGAVNNRPGSWVLSARCWLA